MFLPTTVDYQVFSLLQDIGIVVTEEAIVNGGIDLEWFKPNDLCRDHYFSAGVMNFLLTNHNEDCIVNTGKHRILSGEVDADLLQ